MITKLIRQNIKTLQPYSSARDEFQGSDAIFMDANENPYGILNRYPDPHQVKLKSELARLKGIPTSQIFIGNGSDEIIDLAFRIFCEPGKDKVLLCPPTYGMYKVVAKINNIGVVEVPLTKDFQLNTGEILQQEDIKIIFLCSPNNPTGNSLDHIEKLLQKFSGIVFIDEAYIDFSDRDSFLHQIQKYPNLIVSQTFSKARALAGARVGMAFSSPEIIEVFDRVKPPYNVSVLNQEEALKALHDTQIYESRLREIKTEKDKLLAALQKLRIVKKIYPTEANFILFEVEDALATYTYLVQHKVIIRNRDRAVKNTLRATIGQPEENQKLIEELRNYEKITAY